jgi:23S rRNA pseudouridine2605 synthase
MVFKRPAGSRDDRPNKSQSRSKSGGENTKRPSSSSTGKPFGAGRTDGKKNFSVDKRGSTYSKPNTGKPDSEGSERPKKSYGSGPSSFSGGEKKAFVPKGRPYSGRPADADRPKRSFGDAPQGERKNFTPSDKPYSGRPQSADGETSYKKPSLGPASYGARKNPVAGDKPFNRRPAGTDGPKKSFDGDKKFSPAPVVAKKISQAHQQVLENAKETMYHQNLLCAAVKTRLLKLKTTALYALTVILPMRVSVVAVRPMS